MEDSPSRLIAKVFLLTVVGLIVWLGIIMGVWFLLQSQGIEADLLAMIESLSAALAGAAVFGAGVLAVGELQEASTGRHIDILNQLFEDLNSETNIAARRWIYVNLPDDPEKGVATLPPEGQDAMKRVLNSLDHVAFLTQPGWAPEEIVMPWMNPMIVKVWLKVEPYVLYERERRGEPDYYEHAEQLAIRCLQWREKRFGEKARSKWVDRGL
jgi:hypothetical protein